MALTHPVRLEAVVQETPKDRTLVFRVPAGAESAFAFEPGQFVTFRDTLDGQPVARSYSISSAPDPGSPERVTTFEVTVRDAGAYGAHLYHLPTGAVLEAQPPRGGFRLDRSGRPLLLAAGGSGVTPYRGFVRALAGSDRVAPVVVLHSVRTPDELIFREEFERTARRLAWLTYLPTVTRPEEAPAWGGRRGRIDEALVGSFAPRPTDTVLYACGPNVFVDALVAIARAAGLPPANVRREKWG